ncbi:MAG: hypothetical protein ACRDRR_02845 [Pseudonocardiaceae bacterium]
MTLLHVSFLIAGAGATLYAATVTMAALISALASTPERRRDALKVLKVLLPPLRSGGG